MRISPTGRFLTERDEEITIEVDPVNGAMLASFPGKPSCTLWKSLTINASNGVGVFHAPGEINGTCAVSIVFQFTAGPEPTAPTSPTRYDVTVRGRSDEILHRETIEPPPNEQEIPYEFVVDR